MSKATELRDDELVKLYIALRDRRAKRAADFKLEDTPDELKMDKIEALLLGRMQASGAESVRTKFGTAYRTTKSYASVADWDAFRRFVQENDAWELLTRGANKTAVEQYKAANEDLPPGVNMRTEVVVNFNRPK
jgi:hypothetical protein